MIMLPSHEQPGACDLDEWCYCTVPYLNSRPDMVVHAPGARVHNTRVVMPGRSLSPRCRIVMRGIATHCCFSRHFTDSSTEPARVASTATTVRVLVLVLVPRRAVRQKLVRNEHETSTVQYSTSTVFKIQIENVQLPAVQCYRSERSHAELSLQESSDYRQVFRRTLLLL